MPSTRRASWTSCSAAPEARVSSKEYPRDDRPERTDDRPRPRRRPERAGGQPAGRLHQGLLVRVPERPVRRRHRRHSRSVNLNMATRATALAQDVHEVVLQVNLEAKAGDKVVWLLELQQAGAFVIRNLSANGRRAGALDRGAELPAVVSRARRSPTWSSKGGFPPFLLPLVTFESLHARAPSAARRSARPTRRQQHRQLNAESGPPKNTRGAT